jgi:hypothetical protein
MRPQLSQRTLDYVAYSVYKTATALLKSRWQWCVICGRIIFDTNSLKYTCEYQRLMQSVL